MIYKDYYNMQNKKKRSYDLSIFIWWSTDHLQYLGQNSPKSCKNMSIMVVIMFFWTSISWHTFLSLYVFELFTSFYTPFIKKQNTLWYSAHNDKQVC